MMAEPSPDLWLQRPRPAPADPALRLLCFPYAGGGAAVFRPWQAALPPWVEVLAVKLPGRESRFGEPPAASLPALLEAMVPALLPRLDRPFALFGHSMGALISLGLARRLRALHGLLPAHLFVAGHVAPHRRDEPPIHRLPDGEFVAEIRRRYGDQGGALDEPELLELLLPTLRADVALNTLAEFPPEPPLACRLTAIGGRRDATVAAADLEAWREYATGEFRRHEIEGDHFFLNHCRDDVLRIISLELAEFRASRP